MNVTGNTIMKSLQKRQEAMLKHVARKKAFLARKELMIKDIEEAGNIWIKTMEQLPKREFDSQFTHNESNKIFITNNL